jgi:hypothetical protein
MKGHTYRTRCERMCRVVWAVVHLPSGMSARLRLTTDCSTPRTLSGTCCRLHICACLSWTAGISSCWWPVSIWRRIKHHTLVCIV